MTDNVKTLLARAKDPKEITTWEMLFFQRGEGANPG